MKTTLKQHAKRLLASGVLSATALLLAAPTTQAAVSIDSDLRPEYAPQSYFEIYEEDSEDQFSTTSVSFIIADFAVVLLQISGTIAIFMIIFNGFTYIRAFGRDDQLQKAKKGITWAVIGLIVVILSYAIVQNVIRVVLTVDPSTTSAVSETSEDL